MSSVQEVIQIGLAGESLSYMPRPTKSRTALNPSEQSRATGQPDAMAILMRRTLMQTRAPILSEADGTAGGAREVDVMQADTAQGAQQHVGH
jgi:hypothetical protein